jgi:large subunit ribosomal protein L6
LSKVGKKPIKIPEGVTIEIQPNQVVVKGPQGELKQNFRPEIGVKKEKDQVLVIAKGKGRLTRSLHGLTRTLIANMIQGVTQGFEKTLELHGVGYRVFLEGDKLKLTIGFSHPVMIEPIEGIKFSLEGNNIIKISGSNKQLVGQTAARIRDVKPPDAYKGKGIR